MKRLRLVCDATKYFTKPLLTTCRQVRVTRITNSKKASLRISGLDGAIDFTGLPLLRTRKMTLGHFWNGQNRTKV